MTTNRGRLVALEGIDGCGKSTLTRLLVERLGLGSELAPVATFEPGATPLGASLRSLLLGRDGAPVAPRAEALLMAADRAQHVADVIAPALESGRWVVTDRYSASTLAYQGYGRGLDLMELGAIVDWANGGLRPDLTILLDLPVAVAAARRGGEGDDRMEAEGLAFQQRVADGFLALAVSGPDPWLVVDATDPVELVADTVWAAIAVLAGPGGPP